MRAYAPNGLEVSISLESVLGNNGIYDFERDADGKITYEHDGNGMDVCWDSAEQVTRDGQGVFLDSDGNEWLEHQLRLCDCIGEDEVLGEHADDCHNGDDITKKPPAPSAPERTTVIGDGKGGFMRIPLTGQKEPEVTRYTFDSKAPMNSEHGAARAVLQLADQFMRDWEENEGADNEGNDPDDIARCKAARAKLDAFEAILDAPKPTIAIVLDGGLVQSVVSDRPEHFGGVTIKVIDYDTDGANWNDLHAVPQEDGTLEAAYVHDEEVGRVAIDIAGIRDLTEEEIDAGQVQP